MICQHYEIVYSGVYIKQIMIITSEFLPAYFGHGDLKIKVRQWLATGQCFSLDTPVSSINKTDRHDITKILLKVALNTITTLWSYISFKIPRSTTLNRRSSFLLILDMEISKLNIEKKKTIVNNLKSFFFK
jgi:hypothetical protein